jgi:hypothetical protein
MSEPQDESSKIVVDEDYKEQVAREREQLKEQEAAEAVAETEAKAPSQEATSSQEKSDLPPVPPPTFELLVSSLATQGAAAMGLLPMGEGEEPQVHLDHAKHFIDMLGILEDKTTNNLSADESKFLTETLHQLRMAFVQVK